MKKIQISFFLVFFTAALMYAQPVHREILRGQVISDGETQENITVFNKTTNKGAITDNQGFFTVLAKPKDTLVFSSISFSSKMLVLGEIDFKVKIMVVELDIFVNELDEVVVSPSSLSGDLSKDSRNIKTTQLKSDLNSEKIANIEMEGDTYSSLRNPSMPNDGSILYGMDFVAIGKMIGRSVFGKKEKEKEVLPDYYKDKIVPEIVKEKFTYHFFTETLALKKEEIGLFLDYCDDDPQLKKLLAPNKEIELIDFLIEKSKTFKKQQD